jgi:hypothetical protein
LTTEQATVKYYRGVVNSDDFISKIQNLGYDAEVKEVNRRLIDTIHFIKDFLNTI